AELGADMISVPKTASRQVTQTLARDASSSTMIPKKWGTWDILGIAEQRKCSRRIMTLPSKLAGSGCTGSEAVKLLKEEIKERVHEVEPMPSVERDDILLLRDVEVAIKNPQARISSDRGSTPSDETQAPSTPCL
ncbi:MAG: hypothetical protein M1830_004142, partial [Pleopsidium flavum]